MASKIKNVPEYVDNLFDRARAAQKQIEFAAQEEVDKLCRAITYEVCKPENVKRIGDMAFEESGMGDLQSKYGKLTKKPRGVLWQMRDMKTVGVIEEIPEKGLKKVAKPVGVVGALIPSTQPEITPVHNALCAVKCRDAIVFSPHPTTWKTTFEICEIMRFALKKYGAPEDLIVCAEDPDIPMSELIMEKSDLIIATGGGGMVKAAYSSGTPAYGVGAGNNNQIVAEDADIKDAVKKIFLSKMADLSSGCSCENAVIVNERIYDKFIETMLEEGAHLTNAEEKSKLQKTLWPKWPENHVLNREVIVKPAVQIAAAAGICVSENCRMLLVEEIGSGAEYPFSGEKLSLVLTVYKYKTIDEAIAIINANHAYIGAGHSCGIHTFNDKYVEAVMLKTRTTRVIVRQSPGIANAGTWENGLPFTLTLGCGTWGGNAASENITAKHFMNTTWVSWPLDHYTIPTDEELFFDVKEN